MGNLSNLYSSTPFWVVEFITSGTFTVPPGVTTVLVTMCGGGGGAANVAGGGGSGGWVEKYPLAVIPGETLTITVGAGGSPAPLTYSGSSQSGPTSASPGGNSEILRGSTLLLRTYGGGGGVCGFVAYGQSYGGDGGWPNGSGGGAKKSAQSGAGGCGNRSKTSNSYGSGHYTINYTGLGQGMFPNAQRFGGRTPLATYGHGGDAVTSTSALGAPGAPGVVIFQFFSED